MSDNDPRNLDEFLTVYERFVGEVLSTVHTRVKHLLKSWQEPSFWSSYAGSARRASPSPIQRAHARIKRPESVVDKILRKSHNYSGLSEASLAKMTDTVGARIVVHYLSNLSLVDKAIRGCQELEISTENPPTAYLDAGRITRYGLDHLAIGKKDSGYTSLHYIVRFRDGINGAPCPWFEIQARTMAEDLWAEIEHNLGYKPDKRTTATIRRTFLIISDQLASLDDHFSLLSQDLTNYQGSVIYQDTDPLNPENLPAVLAELDIRCSQEDLDGLLKLLFSRGVRVVGDWRRAASRRRLDLADEIFRSQKDRSPNSRELVAVIGTLAKSTQEADEPELVRLHIAYMDAWDSLKA